MGNIDILGLPLSEGLKVIEKYNFKVKIIETQGLNKTFIKQLSEPRIIKVIELKNEVTITVGYF